MKTLLAILLPLLLPLGLEGAQPTRTVVTDTNSILVAPLDFFTKNNVATINTSNLFLTGLTFTNFPSAILVTDSTGAVYKVVGFTNSQAYFPGTLSASNIFVGGAILSNLPNAILSTDSQGSASKTIGLTNGIAYFPGDIWATNLVTPLIVETYATNVIMNLARSGMRSISLTGDLTLAATNMAPGKIYLVRLLSQGVIANLTFPTSWHFPDNVKPASMASNEVDIMSLSTWGTGDPTSAYCTWTSYP